MYTHRWAYQPSHPAYREAWPTILHDARRIIDHIHGSGIVLAGPDGLRTPILDPVEGIAFNGDATRSLHGDPFHLLAPLPSHPRGIPTATAHCTTSRRPYDLAVAAVLLRCALLLPDAFAVASDGRWDQEWAHGSPAWPAAAIRLGARQVIADLFDVEPENNPLRGSLTGVRFTAPATPPKADRPPARTFPVDQAVHVHAYGNWRAGTVTRIGRTRVTVRYTRNADGQPDERAFPTDQIQPADGVALVPVHQLRRGDIVVHAAGEDRTVAEVGQGQRRYRTVTYTDGSQAQISAQTLMRVRT
jgi:hypothetical protein